MLISTYSIFNIITKFIISQKTCLQHEKLFCEKLKSKIIFSLLFNHYLPRITSSIQMNWEGIFSIFKSKIFYLTDFLWAIGAGILFSSLSARPSSKSIIPATSHLMILLERSSFKGVSEFFREPRLRKLFLDALWYERVWSKALGRSANSSVIPRSWSSWAEFWFSSKSGNLIKHIKAIWIFL